VSSISKIRITNYKFDGGKSTLINETFDLKSKSTLINLVNGGGKTSLIHFILQVINPEVRVATRTIDNYFQKDNTAHALIEWDIDGRKLATGIAMKKSLTKTSGVDFFTYIFEYLPGEYKIEDFPLIDGKSILDLKSARTKIDSMSNPKVKTYSDKSKYRKDLEGWGIFKSEWEFIFTLNKEKGEGSIDKLFANSKKTKQVLENWIIPNLLIGNAKDDYVVNIEKNIRNFHELNIDKENQEKYKEYMVDLDKLTNDISDCKDKDSQIKGILEDASAFKREVALLLHKTRHNEEQKKRDLEENEGILEDIRFKLDSFNFSKDRKIVDELEEERSNLESKKTMLEEDISSLSYRINLYTGKRIIDDINVRTREVANLEESLRSLELKNEEITKELDKIRYSLKIAYEKRLESAKTDYNDIKIKLEQVNKELKETRDGKDEYTKKIERFKNQIDFIKEKISEHNRLEQAIKEDIISKFPQPALLIEDDHLDYFKALRQSKESEYDNCGVMIQLMSEENDKIALEIEEIDKIIANRQNERNDFLNQKKHYENQYEKVIKAIGRFSLGDKDIFSSEAHDKLMLKNIELDAERREKEEELSKVNKQISSLEKGHFNLSDQLVDLLNEKGIDFTLGLDWLKSQDEISKGIYLDKNPLLPYSIIVSSRDIKHIKTLNFEKIDTVCSIIISETLTDPFIKSKENSIIEVSGNYFILPFYSELIVDDEKLEKHKEMLNIKKINLTEEMKNVKSEIDFANKALNIVLDFTSEYGVATLPGLNQNIESIERKITELDNSKNKNISLKEQNEKKKKETYELRDQLKDQVSIAKIDVEKLEKYFDKRKENEANINEKNELEKNLTNSKKQLDHVNKCIHKLEEESREYSEKKIKLNQMIEEVKKNLGSYDTTKETEVDTRSIEELKGSEEALSKRLKSEGIYNIDEYKKEISRKNAELKNQRNQFEKLRVAEEDTEKIVYSEDTVNELTERHTLINQQYETAKESLSTLKGKLEEKRSQLENKNKDLIEKYGKTPYIFDDPDTHTESSIKKELSDHKSLYEELKNELDSLIKTVRHITSIKDQFENRIRDNEIVLPKTENQMEVSIEDIEKVQSEIIDTYKNYVKDLTNLKSKARKTLNTLYGKYVDLRGSYEFLRSLKDSEDQMYDYAIISDKLVYQKDITENQIENIRQRISEVQNDKKSLVSMILQKLDMLISDLNEFDSKSKIEIDGMTRKLIELKVPVPNEDLKRKHLEDYIDKVINETMVEIEAEESDNKDALKILKEKLKINSLLNAITPLDNYSLRVYKAKDTVQMGEMVKWEALEPTTSGGEGSAAMLFLFSTIITYKRYKTLIKEGRNDNFNKIYNSPKVLIMDNPFGAMSSKHLVKPVLDLAEKYNIQMICFTAITDRSVIDQFNLVYTLYAKITADKSNKFLSVRKEKDIYENKDDADKILQTVLFEVK
jgi:hypothetical protein